MDREYRNTEGLGNELQVKNSDHDAARPSLYCNLYVMQNAEIDTSTAPPVHQSAYWLIHVIYAQGQFQCDFAVITY